MKLVDFVLVFIICAEVLFGCDMSTDYKQRTADKIFSINCRQQCLYKNEKNPNLTELDRCFASCEAK